MKLIGRGTAVGLAALSGAFAWGFFAQGHGRGTQRRRYLGRKAELLARIHSSREGYWLDTRNQVLLLADPQSEQADTLLAVSLVCTHLGCSLQPSPGKRELVCPCHGSAFAFLGGDGQAKELGRVQVGPATRDLDRYRVVQVADRLFLEI